MLEGPPIEWRVRLLQVASPMQSQVGQTRHSSVIATRLALGVMREARAPLPVVVIVRKMLVAKTFRAIATRYDKTARDFCAAVLLTAGLIWLN